jgi:hypothetical protein
MIISLPVDYRADIVLRQSPLVISPPVSLGNDIKKLRGRSQVSESNDLEIIGVRAKIIG